MQNKIGLVMISIDSPRLLNSILHCIPVKPTMYSLRNQIDFLFSDFKLVLKQCPEMLHTQFVFSPLY